MQPIRACALVLCAFSTARAQQFAPYAGNYRTSNHDVIAIAEWEVDPTAPRVLAFTNLHTGRFGILTRTGTDRFMLAAGIMTGQAVAQIVFHRSGHNVTSLRYIGVDEREHFGERIPTRSESLSVAVKGARLGATLMLPAGRGPFPAVVLVPAGALGRTATATFPNFFLTEGFAVLVYDRRPPSSANTFDTYASDAVMAVEHLRQRSDIDHTRVGLWGHSQGGFLSLIAASQSPSVAFVIDHSGMLVPAWQQELFRVAAEAEADSVPPSDIAAALQFEHQFMNVARTGIGWDALARRMQTDSAASWMSLVYRPGSLTDLTSVWKNDFSFDPRPVARQVRQPVLALFGGLDKSTPIASAANLANAMKPDTNLTIAFFPTANHAFLDAVTGGNAEVPSLSQFVPGMFEAMHHWLRTRRTHR